MQAPGGEAVARDLRNTTMRIAARKRRLRSPQEAGLPRRLAWWAWQCVSSLARPAVFAVFAGIAAFWAFDGLRHLDAAGEPSGREDRISAIFSGLAPDAGQASSIWGRELSLAMRPRGGAPADSALAASLVAAFEDIVGRERFASLIWAELNERSYTEAEAVLRALPVWVRQGELQSAWTGAMSGPASQQAGILALAPAAARNRLDRTARLYDAIQASQAAFFAGHEQGALNLALLPGLAAQGADLWLLSDADAAAAHCPAGEAVECSLARLGQNERSGQGARLIRAALLTGHARAPFRTELDAAPPATLEAIASEISAVARHTSSIDAIRLVALLETPQDASRLRRLSMEAGARTLALAHFHGRDVLALDRGDSSGSIVTPEALERFILSGVCALLALGIVLAALASAVSVRSSGQAGLGQRIDIRARELLLGRKD